ncbi:hypothetical protein TNCV_3549181 [Trichonephila clavipes]|nr:hypothetical protein TNCV_3549181 [Trichonephila clavipes]
MDAGLSGLSVSHASKTTACLHRRAPIMRRKRFFTPRERQTRDEMNAEREGPRETCVLKRRARRIMGENRGEASHQRHMNSRRGYLPGSPRINEK